VFVFVFPGVELLLQPQVAEKMVTVSATIERQSIVMPICSREPRGRRIAGLWSLGFRRASRRC
jgi:hypothetical protein